VPDDAPYLLDVTRLIWRRWKGRYPTGIDRVCLAYLRHFGPNAQAVVQYDGFRRILDRRASRDLFHLLENPGQNFKGHMMSGALKHLGRSRAKGDGRVYLNVGHTGLNAPGFRDWVAAAHVKPIYLIHDLIPITHAQFCRAGERERHENRVRTVLTTAAGLIGNSQATLDELAEFARQQELPSPPQVPAWLGADPLPKVSRRDADGRPMFITLGTIEARKNHLLLLDIWSRLVDLFGRDAPQLLIIGQRGWEAAEVFDRLDRSERLRGHVVELNDCTDEEIAQHLGSARALLFPSFVEGYGLPLIEALAAGVPAIVSDLPVFREICGNIPAYLGPFDASGWEATILDYARSESVARDKQLKRMENFRPPEWETHFSIVERWIETIG
jgi:glycosyltransferase involved in cell wall biosynthesis